MQVRCPYCQHEIEIVAGGQYTCEKCRAIFRVDMEAPPAAAPPPAAAAPLAAAAPSAPPSPAPPSAPPPGARCARHPDQAAVAVCARCGNFTCGACSVLLPQGRVCPDCAERLRAADFYTPWEDRQRLGMWPALKATVAGVLFRPTEFFRKMPRVGGWEGPVLFLIICNFVSTACAAVPMALGMSMVDPAAFRQLGLDPQLVNALASGGAVRAITQVVLSPIAAIIAVLVGGGLMHLGLMCTGAAKNGFEATVRVYCYWSSFILFNIIGLPLSLVGIFAGAGMGPMGTLGAMYTGQSLVGLITLFWGLPVLVIGFREAHETTTMRALGFILMPIFFVCCCAGCFVLMIPGLRGLR